MDTTGTGLVVIYAYCKTVCEFWEAKSGAVQLGSSDQWHAASLESAGVLVRVYAMSQRDSLQALDG